jgi:NADPH:quinone reductase-like Zn-dependent oxidoreductase
MMKALIRDRYGAPDALQVREVDRPVPKEREVLLRVRAASINDWDWAMHQRPPFPLSLITPWVPILGSDVAGEVVSVGSGVTRWRVGDEVYGDLSRFGAGGFAGFAEYVCAAEDQLIRKPQRMTFEQAASLPQAGQLAVQGLAANGPLQAGQRILINGAGGGVGTIAVQLAKPHGVELTGVDRADKLDTLRALGFHHVIDYQSEDFTRNGQRYDLILDAKTTRSPFSYPRALKPRGTYATVGGLNGRLLQTVASSWLIRNTTRKTVGLIALKANQDLATLNERFEAGQLVPVIDRVYELSRGADAFRHFGAANHKGKVVFTIG